MTWMLDQLDEHAAAAKALEGYLPDIERIGRLMVDCFSRGGTLYTFGNGGSAADAQHFTGELIGHYKRERRALPAVTLSTDPTVMTCISNDYTYDSVFSRQVDALVGVDDVVAGFTTSGNSSNVVAGLASAREAGATTVLFGGGDGGRCAEYADYSLIVPSKATARIQEMHTLMLHMLSEMIDMWAYDTEIARNEA